MPLGLLIDPTVSPACHQSITEALWSLVQWSDCLPWRWPLLQSYILMGTCGQGVIIFSKTRLPLVASRPFPKVLQRARGWYPEISQPPELHPLPTLLKHFLPWFFQRHWLPPKPTHKHTHSPCSFTGYFRNFCSQLEFLTKHRTNSSNSFYFGHQ